MAFEKVKTLRAAERYLELGKIPAAISEYYKIVEGEPDDYTTINMLGDLYVRVGNRPAAFATAITSPPAACPWSTRWACAAARSTAWRNF